MSGRLDSQTDQLVDFVANCREGRPPEVGGKHGLSGVATALAFYL